MTQVDRREFFSLPTTEQEQARKPYSFRQTTAYVRGRHYEARKMRTGRVIDGNVLLLYLGKVSNKVLRLQFSTLNGGEHLDTFEEDVILYKRYEYRRDGLRFRIRAALELEPIPEIIFEIDLRRKPIASARELNIQLPRRPDTQSAP